MGWAMTVTVAPALASPDVAVTIVSPLATAATIPSASTVATPSSADAHATAASAATFPFASVTSAVNCAVSPSIVRVTSLGMTVTAAATCATITEAVPLAAPEIAVIVAEPLPAAVTSPFVLTVATASALDDQATAAPAMAFPFWSSTEAVNWAVSPSDESEAVAGDTWTVVATGSGSGGGAVVSSSPHESVVNATSNADAMYRRWLSDFMDSLLLGGWARLPPAGNRRCQRKPCSDLPR